VEHLNDKDELTRLENLAQKLGFTVIYNLTLSWNHSKVSFYPCRRILIGTKNYSPNSNIGYGTIPDKVKALILNHELGHILVYETLYPNMDLAEFCLSDDSKFLIQQEIYAWKTVANESLDNNLDPLVLELIQETINEYVYCEFIGTCTIESQQELQQKIITKFTKKSEGL
jgi:hypothetical protein